MKTDAGHSREARISGGQDGDGLIENNPDLEFTHPKPARPLPYMIPTSSKQ
jgi:hypothetical protein